MKTFCAPVARVQCVRLSLSPFFAAALVMISSNGLAQAQPTIVRVEEDWEVVVISPSATSNSPQITCAMSPCNGDHDEYMSFELNHQSQPDYAPGGLHVHAWESEYLMNSVHTQRDVILDEQNETVRWTQSLSIADGVIIYEITNGESESWGTFGTGELRLTVATHHTDLNGYDVEKSVAGSGVGYGANRVSSMVLKRVRLVTASGELFEFELNRNILAGESEGE